MAESEKFTDWELWKARCIELGLEGPYKISGSVNTWQYVTPKGNTAAMFNVPANWGFVSSREETS